MSRKTLQVSEELHKQLKLKSVEEGIPIQELISNLMNNHTQSPADVVEKVQTTQKPSEEVIIVKVPHELLYKIQQAGCSKELTAREYEVRPSHGGIEILSKYGRTSLCPETCKADAPPGLKRRCVLEDLIDYAKFDVLQRNANHIIDSIKWRMLEYPPPEERARLKKHVEELKSSMNNGIDLKSKVLEIDPDWEEFDFDLDKFDASNGNKGWICYLF